MNFYNFSLVDIEQFLMVLFRISGVIIFAPFYGSRDVPIKLRVFFCFLVAIIVFPTLKGILPTVPTNSLIHLSIISAVETMIGMSIGIIALVIFAGAQLAGQYIGMQMGYGIVNVIDPYTSTQVSILSQLQNIITMWIFLLINGHHWFLQGIADSFNIIQLGGAKITQSLVMNLLSYGGEVFVIGFKVGAPGIITLLFADLMMGIIAKTVPQINILIVGFPIKVGLGLLATGWGFNLIYIVLEKYFFQFYREMNTIFRLFS
jgi:flagellar biosynthesis protein FliR